MKNMDDINITFSKSVRKDILELLGKTVDKSGVIVEKDNLDQKVPSFDSTELTLKEFGGIQKGSEVFISNNLVTLMKLVERG